MQARPTITFEVTYKGRDDDGNEVLRCLTESGEFTADRSLAAKFKLYASLTNAQRVRVEMRKHEIAGGYADWSDMQHAIARGRETILARLEKTIWVDGRPEVKTAKESAEQFELIDKAWRESDDEEVRHVNNLRALSNRISFMAEWEFLACDVPDGWKSLAERSDEDDAVFLTVWNCYEVAAKAYEAGKRKPS